MGNSRYSSWSAGIFNFNLIKNRFWEPGLVPVGLPDKQGSLG